MRNVLWACFAAPVLVGCAALAGCATASTGLPPDGLAFSVYQNRTDVSARKLEVSFENDTGSALTVTRLELTAGQFSGKAIWPKDSTTIPAGVTISLPVPLPAPDCESTPTDARVEFDYQLADGRVGTAVATPVDALERLPGIRQEDCIAVSVASIVTVSMDGAPRATTLAGRAIAELDLIFIPTGATGSVTFESSGSTTLLTPVDPDGVDQPEGVIARTVGGADAPSMVTLRYAPNRCDAHAIAEDKRGTIIPLAVSTTTGFGGRLYVSAPDEVRDALYEFVRTACGLPTG